MNKVFMLCLIMVYALAVTCMTGAEALDNKLAYVISGLIGSGCVFGMLRLTKEDK